MRKGIVFSLEALFGLLTALTFLYLLPAHPASEISYSSIRQYQLLQDLAETGVRGNRPMFESWDDAGIRAFYAPLVEEAGDYCFEVRKLKKSDGYLESPDALPVKINCDKSSYSTVLKTRRLLYSGGFYYLDAHLRQ